MGVPGCGCVFMGVYVYLHMPLLVKNDMAGLIKGAILAALLCKQFLIVGKEIYRTAHSSQTSYLHVENL